MTYTEAKRIIGFWRRLCANGRDTERIMIHEIVRLVVGRDDWKRETQQTRAALAAATARAEAAERDAADVRRWADAVPVEELRRYYFHSIAFVDPDSSYTDTDAAADCFAIGAWLVRQAVQP